MKVGIYQEIKDQSDPENFEVYNALKRRSDIEEIVFVNPKKLQIKIIAGQISFMVGDVSLCKESIDVLFIRGGFSNKPMLIEVVKYCRKQGIKVFDNNFSEIKYLLNKRADYVKFAANQIPVPNTWLFSNMEDVAETNLAFPLVMKTTNTGKGKNIFMVNSIGDIEKVLAEKDKKILDFMLQEVIDYEHDLRVLVCGDEVIGCMKRMPKDGDFRANFSLGGTVEPFEATEEIKDLAIRTAKACELQISGVDVLVEKNNGTLWILEANRTPGLEGITQAIGNAVSDRVVEFMLEKAY